MKSLKSSLVLILLGLSMSPAFGAGEENSDSQKRDVRPPIDQPQNEQTDSDSVNRMEEATAAFWELCEQTYNLDAQGNLIPGANLQPAQGMLMRHAKDFKIHQLRKL